MKKKVLLQMMLLPIAMTSFAQMTGDGYYRVSNVGLETKGSSTGVKETGYMWIVDCNGEVIIQSSAADTHALQVHPSSQDPTAEPSSIIYVKIHDANAKTYDMEGQGVSVSNLISYYPKVTEIVPDKSDPTKNQYIVSASRSGVTSYLCSSNIKKYDLYYPSNTNYTKYDIDFRKWQLHPVSSSSENYFGVKPTLEVNGKYYAPFYASFPFKFASSGMKAYIIKSVSQDGIAVLKEIDSDVIPGATPMLIECSSKNVSDNRLDLVYGDNSSVSNNKLNGTYFCNFYIDVTNNPTVVTAFDSNKMRTWNVENGKLVLSKSTGNLQVNAKGDDGSRYINANTSYLDITKVPSAASFESLTVMTEDEYQKLVDGIEDINTTSNINNAIFSVDGVRLNKVQKGINIVNGKKVIAK